MYGEVAHHSRKDQTLGWAERFERNVVVILWVKVGYLHYLPVDESSDDTWIL